MNKIFLIFGMMLILATKSFSSQITNCINIVSNLDLVLRLSGQGKFDARTQLNSDEAIKYELSGPETNVIYLRKFPSGNFEFHLFDENGNELPKTQIGIEATGFPPKPITRDDLVSWKEKRFFPFMVGNGSLNQTPLFRPDDVFVITNKGIYDLVFQLRLCVIMTNNAPDLMAMIDGRNASARGVKFIKDFGVLTSPPLRVKIIKK